MISTITGWFFKPVAMGRIAALRTLAYLFIPVDLLFSASWVVGHKDVPGALYMPLHVGDLLHLPTPTHTLVITVFTSLLILSVPAAANLAPRVLGIVVACLYFEWMIIAMSYGKVDHDRFAYLVLLAVLPTLGKAKWGDTKTMSPSAGWACNLVQIAVICTYFLAAWSKMRFGGIDWLNSATITRAVLRRGTGLSTWMLEYPWTLKAAQYGIFFFELLTPIVLFLRNDRLRNWIVAGFYGFHAMVFATITIIFLPHLVAMAAFLPLEKFRPIVWLRSRRTQLKPATQPDKEPMPATTG